MDPEVIASNSVTIMPSAILYRFAVLTSNVHMAWMRTVDGRLKSDYRYSEGIVYNTFPWPTPADAQKLGLSRPPRSSLMRAVSIQTAPWLTFDQQVQESFQADADPLWIVHVLCGGSCAGVQSTALRYGKKHYFLFSKSGLTKGCTGKVQELGNVSLVTYAELVKTRY